MRPNAQKPDARVAPLSAEAAAYFRRPLEDGGNGLFPSLQTAFSSSRLHVGSEVGEAGTWSVICRQKLERLSPGVFGGLREVLEQAGEVFVICTQ